MGCNNRVLCFFILLLLVVQPQPSYATRPWLFADGGDTDTVTDQIGICASSVNVWGYKCQEIHVSVNQLWGYCKIMCNIAVFA